ncbi:MAG: hypothetical protein IKZ00_01520, partial [Bacteroidaceae bacterium]|nr:hypothetical protein [Bacteroidaceae bacterium]
MKKIYYFLMAVCLLTVNAAYAQDAGSFTIVDGDIQINSQEDFDKWIVAMNETEDFYYQDVDLNVDVEVASTYDSPFYVVPCFNAEFNGNGHRLTLNLSTSENEHEAGLTFIQLLYGTVKNLYVDGTIEGSVKCMGPIAKDLCENSVVENVCSTVDIVSGTYGDGTHGGIAGRCTGNSTIRNVVFAGSITGKNTDSCAGFVGWNDSKLTVENSLMIAKIDVNHQGGNTICRGSSPVCKNVYSNVEIEQTPDGCHIVTAEQLASGAVCFALNGDQKNIAWYQNLNEDQVPVLDNTHKTVYADAKEYKCDGSVIGEVTYTNEKTLEPNIPDHAFGDMGLCNNCGAANPDFITQDENGFFLVNTPEKLVYIANFASNENPDINIKITADLDMKEVSDQYSPIRGYSGTFDGGGHTISNLVINNPDKNFQGLIGEAGNCTIKNLTLDETCSVTGAEMCGGFVGATSGQATITMENLVMNGDVTASRNAAGIFGCNNNGKATVFMTNCGVSGHIKEGGWYSEPGAMSGWFGNNATVTNCWFVGTIEGYKNENDAFCRGGAGATLTNCYSVIGQKPGVTNISADAAASGELTWKLNGEKSTDVVWYQTIGKDLCPTLNSDHGIVSFSNNGSYISQKTVEIKISEENEWITYMQPFATELPTGVQAFTADGVNGDYLILKEASSLNANTPYILYAEDGHESSQTGTMEVAEGKAVKAGVLSGALEAQQITSGYVLQNQGNGAMFFKVN